MRRWIFTLTGLLLFALAAFQPAQAQLGGRQVLVLQAEGPLTPAMAQYLERGLRIAEQRDAEALVFQLNTPGGSVDLMGEMVAMIRASEVPVLVYVAPRGAMAGSAGTVITLAGHVAAMAPETAIGAASPVGSQGEDLSETIETKLKESLRAQVRALASRRGPEAVALAEATIEEAKAASVDEAYAIGLIDFVARDVADLLQQADGFEVETAAGSRRLSTAAAYLDFIDMSFIEQLLNVLTNPNIAFILLTIGVQAILIELSSPGGWVAGFVGVVSLSLAAYSLGALPVNWFGLIFLVMAFVLFVLDFKTPTYGALTAAGVGSLIVGALVLFNSPATPQFQRVSVPLVVGVSIFSGALFATALTFAIRSLQTPVRMGQEALPGRTGLVKTAIPAHGSGQVQVASELWSAELAEGKQPIPAGVRVEVVAVQGLRLKVRAIPED